MPEEFDLLLTQRFIFICSVGWILTGCTATALDSKVPSAMAHLHQQSDTQDFILNPPSSADLNALTRQAADGVVYLSLSESTLPQEIKDEIKQSTARLNATGSFSAGQITHEFSHLTEKRAALNKDHAINFIPTEIEKLIQNMPLTGKWYSGVFNDGKYNSLYRLYESADGQRKFEITEMYLDAENGSSTEVFYESLNHQVNQVPMTFEHLKTAQGEQIYNVSFNHRSRYYSLSSLGFNRAELDRILKALTQSSE